MADGEKAPDFKRGKSKRERGGDAERTHDSGIHEKKRQRGRGGSGAHKSKEKKNVRFAEKPPFPPFTQSDSPFNEVTENGLFEAHKTAARMLYEKRPQMPLPDGDDARAKKLAFNHDEDARLSMAFDYQKSIHSPETQKKLQKSQAFSQILEAMILTGGKKLFGEPAAMLPAQFSDRKDATDVVVELGDGVGLAIDAATEQDLEGYPLPDGTMSKGIEEKIGKSYRNIASDFGNITRVQYTGNEKRTTMLENMPRVVLGLSQDTIARLAPEWAKNPEGFDPHEVPEFRQMKRSAARQLRAQLPIAIEEQKRTKKRKEGVSGEADSLRRVLAALSEKTGGSGIGEEVTDSVVEKLNKAVSDRNTRERIIAAAKREQAEWHQGYAVKEKERGVAEFMLDDAQPLFPHEETRLTEHFTKHVKKEDRAQAEPALRAFLAKDPATNPSFPKELFPIVVGGIPVRLWRRLMKATGMADATKEKTETQKQEPHADPQTVKGESGAAGVTSIPESLSIPVAGAATHLAAIRAQVGKFEKRSTRLWSRLKNGFYNALTSAAAIIGAKSAAWILCALGVGTLGALGGGLVAALGLGFGLRHFFKKRGYMDDPRARERAGAIQAVERLKVSDPEKYAYLTNHPEEYEKEVAKKTRIRMRVLHTAQVLGNAAASWGTLELSSGGRFTDTLWNSPWSEKVNNTLALFSCAESHTSQPLPPGIGVGGGTGSVVSVPPGSGGGASMAAPATISAAPSGGNTVTEFVTVTDPQGKSIPKNATILGKNWFGGEDYVTKPHALDPRFMYDPNNPWGSASQMIHGAPPPPAPANVHLDCCYEGYMPLGPRVQALAHGRGHVLSFGSGAWNNSGWGIE